MEQYCIDANSAADIIYYAGFEYNDVKRAIIFDLGAGTGRFSIASALFGANHVLSIDIDYMALRILKKNITALDLDHIISPICTEIGHLEISKTYLPDNTKITTIMNPPFGVQTKSADRIFLKKAFSFSDVVYSIHVAGDKVQNFLKKFIRTFYWKIDNIIPYNLILEKSFPFHSQKTKKIEVDVYRFIKEK